MKADKACPASVLLGELDMAARCLPSVPSLSLGDIGNDCFNVLLAETLHRIIIFQKKLIIPMNP